MFNKKEKTLNIRDEESGFAVNIYKQKHKSLFCPLSWPSNMHIVLKWSCTSLKADFLKALWINEKAEFDYKLNSG